MQFFEDRSDAACRVVIRNLPWALPQRVTFLPVGEIGHGALGRGGAERSECPPTYEPTSARPPAPRRYNNRGVPWVAWYAHGDGATGGHLDRNDILAMPTVGAGSSRFSRRFPRPSRPSPRILSRPPFPVVIPAWSCRHRGVCSDVACRVAIRRRVAISVCRLAPSRKKSVGKIFSGKFTTFAADLGWCTQQDNGENNVTRRASTRVP